MNKDLHATHQIVSLLERSKGVTDRILDQMPGIFVTVDSEGTILRANLQASEVLNSSHEEAVGRSVSELFTDLTWKKFRPYFLQIVSRQSHSVEFELELDASSKPRSFFWQIYRLNIRTTNHEERTFFSIQGRDITDLKEALDRVSTLKGNLELAKAVQSLILPRTNFFESKNIKLSAYYEAAEVAGGDLWWFDVNDSDRSIVLMGDVTGHGVGSAMVTSLVCGGIATLQRLERTKGPKLNMEKLFDTVNASLLRLEGNPYWLTLFSIEVDHKAKVFQWISAAAPPVYHLKQNGELEPYVDISNHLGTDDFLIAKGEVKFSKGDRLFMFTDGIPEMYNPAGQAYGFRNMERSLKRTLGQDINRAKEIIIEDMSKWRSGHPLKDDSAFVLVDL